MPEEYNKIAEGIVKGTVPMVASFVERYISDDEPGFFAGDRERVEGDIRAHVTVFAYLDQSDGNLPESAQLGIVDLQQLPDDRSWMVVGVLPAILENEAWLNDLYSQMVRRLASRLVQFGFLDAPHRPRLRSASTLALTQVAQAAKPLKAATIPHEPATGSAPRPAPSPAPPPNGHQAEPARSAPAAAPAPPPAAPAPEAPRAAAPAQPAQFAQSAQPIAAQVPPAPARDFLANPSAPRLDLVLTVAMVFIWLVACGMLTYLLVLLLR